MKIKSIDENSYASSPGSVSISEEKLRNLRPDLYGVKGGIKGAIYKILIGFTQKREIKEHIFYGDSQPGIVMSKIPLIIVAYSEDLDCIVPLKFPDEYAEKYMLEEKTRLITINTYMRGTEIQRDIILGPNNNQRWNGYSPIIGQFITDDIDILAKKKEDINEEMWDYVYKLGLEYREKHSNIYRDGRPIFSQKSSL
jgi:hypothetical protein